MDTNKNSIIQCTVSSCSYHNPQNYCNLNQIQVGCCNNCPTDCEGTECASFQLSAQNSAR